MKDIDVDILSLFRGSPNEELSTSDIVENIYPSFSNKMNMILKDPYTSKEDIERIKNERAKLHRRVLHHISKLINDNLIKVSDIKGKGKKYYRLSITEDEELVIDKYRKKLVISKPSVPALPLGNLEENKYIFRVGGNHFFDRLNCVFVESDNFSGIKELYDFVYDLFPYVNDVIGLYAFEHILQNNKIEYVVDNMLKLDEEAKSYNKRVSCIIDLTHCKDCNALIDFFHEFFTLNPEYTTFIIDATSREILEKNELISELIEIYAKFKRKLNIKNDSIYQGPYILGKAGPYSIPESDWKNFSQKSKKKYKAIILAQSSFIIDLNKIYEDKPSAKYLKEVLMNCSKSLHYANTYQRKHSEDYFNHLNPDKKIDTSEIFNFSKNYLRFWNYELSEDIEENTLFLETLREIKKELMNFARTEETIYMSCGMPMSYKLSFSIAYRKFNEHHNLQYEHDQISIKNHNDLSSKEIRNRLLFLEKSCKLFDGGFEVRFFRKGNVDSTDIIREINIVMNSYTIPLFCYNFSEQVGSNMKLEWFMKNGNN